MALARELTPEQTLEHAQGSADLGVEMVGQMGGLAARDWSVRTAETIEDWDDLDGSGKEAAASSVLEATARRVRSHSSPGR